MYRTIRLSSCISMQGEVQEQLADGRITIRVGKTSFTGWPVGAPKKAA